MKRPDICLMKVEKCEDCKYWEPIPFHHKGGECIPPEEETEVKIFVHTPMGNLSKVPVKV
jgi:hypothetical protein